jgi:hypothetical protein
MQSDHQTDDLCRWLHDEPTRARPAWLLRRTWLWARRNKGWATAIITALLGLAALGGVWLESLTYVRIFRAGGI